MTLIETKQERINQKFLALEMWCKRARDLAALGVNERALEALVRCTDCLHECKRVLSED